MGRCDEDAWSQRITDRAGLPQNLAEANGTLVFDTPKSHQERVLRIGPSLAARIGRHLETLPCGEDALLFVTPGGKPLRYNQWRKAYFDPTVAAAGLTTSRRTISAPRTGRGSPTGTA